MTNAFGKASASRHTRASSSAAGGRGASDSGRANPRRIRRRNSSSYGWDATAPLLLEQAALGDAVVRPGFDRACQKLPPAAGRELYPHLVHGRLDLAVEAVAAFADDRELLDVVEERPGEAIDLRLRRLPSGVNPEVHDDFRSVVRLVCEDERRVGHAGPIPHAAPT